MIIVNRKLGRAEEFENLDDVLAGGEIEVDPVTGKKKAKPGGPAGKAGGFTVNHIQFLRYIW